MPNCKICGKVATTGAVVHTECLNRWIPVTERLPETNDDIFVATKSGETAVGYYKKASKTWGSPGGFNLTDVTHWMPLPEPPEKDGAS